MGLCPAVVVIGRSTPPPPLLLPGIQAELVTIAVDAVVADNQCISIEVQVHLFVRRKELNASRAMIDRLAEERSVSRDLSSL